MVLFRSLAGISFPQICYSSTNKSFQLEPKIPEYSLKCKWHHTKRAFSLELKSETFPTLLWITLAKRKKIFQWNKGYAGWEKLRVKAGWIERSARLRCEYLSADIDIACETTEKKKDNYMKYTLNLSNQIKFDSSIGFSCEYMRVLQKIVNHTYFFKKCNSRWCDMLWM